MDLMISAIRRAIEYCHSHDTLTSTTIEAKESTPDNKQQKADVHESDAADTDRLETQLKEKVIAVFGSARAAFDTNYKNGVVGKKEWKRLLKKVLPSLKPVELKRLRRILPHRMASLDFCTFIGGSQDTAASSTDKVKGYKREEAESSGLASLPPEVPEVCVSTASHVVFSH